MKKMKGIRTIVALLLVFVLVFGGALADDSLLILDNLEGHTIYHQYGDVTGDNSGIEIQKNAGTVDIDANTVTGNAQDGIEIQSNAGTVDIDVTNTITGVRQDGIEIQTNAGEIDINADTVTGAWDGIEIQSNAGEIDIGADAVSGIEKGIEISGNSGEIDIDANKVTAASDDGISIEGGSASGTINLNVGDVSGGDGGRSGSGINIDQNAGTVNINQKMKTDPVTSETTGTSISGLNGRMSIEMRNNTGVINLNQEKDATPGNVTGSLWAYNNQGSINLTVANADRIEVLNDNSSQKGSSFVAHAENVVGHGVTVMSTKDSDAVSITVNGKVVSVNDTNQAITTDGSNITVRAGEVSATGDEIHSNAFGLMVNGGTVVVAENEENTEAKGNVTAKSVAVYNNPKAVGLDLMRQRNSDVVVEGTLYGDTAAIELGGLFGGNAEVTVWKIETGNGGTLVLYDDANGSFAAAINYIAKAAKSAAEQLTITGQKTKTVTLNEGKSVWERSWETAKADEEVTITLKENEGLDSIYYFYDDDTKEGKAEDLLTIGNGIAAVANTINSFVVRMRAAGGMKLGGLKTHAHEFTVYQSTVSKPTCTTTGTDIYKCAHCDATKQVTVAALGHDFGEWKQTKAPTCEEKGEEQRTCQREGCGAVDKRDIAALGHTEVKDPAVAATCTTAGKTAGSHCSVCNKVLVAQEVVKAKGHTPAAAVKENEKAAQVGVAGSYDEVVYCKDCGAELSRKTVTVPALPEPEPEPEIANTVTYYTLSFYEDAQSAATEVKVKAGDTYTLPTPVREGKTFVGWAVSDVPPADPSWEAPVEGDAGVLAGGTEYKVTENKSFVGIWK